MLRLSNTACVHACTCSNCLFLTELTQQGEPKCLYGEKHGEKLARLEDRVIWQAQSQLLFCMKTVHHIKYIINLRKLAFLCYNVAWVRQMNILLKTNFLHINGGSVVELALLNKTTNTILFTFERWIEQYTPYACLC